MRGVETPAVPQKEERLLPDGEQPGKLAKTCRQHVCGLLYIMRGCRPDLAYAVGRLSRKMHKWTRADDVRLHRVFAYLAKYPDLGLAFFVNTNDRSNFKTELYVDTDHGGDLETSRSTSGSVLLIMGPRGSRCHHFRGCQGCRRSGHESKKRRSCC